MNLYALRSEVLGHGFDQGVYGARINQYLNDALNLICRRIDYYVDEAVFTFSTTGGTATYPLPAAAAAQPSWATYSLPSGGFARIRELFATDLNSTVQAVPIGDMDRSSQATGRPYFYAMEGSSLRLYPTPDGTYPLELRYWQMPVPMINDTDVPVLPADWHSLLWIYATWMCYESDDDATMGQYWQGRFDKQLAEFSADQKFPSTEYPTQAAGMWDQGRTLSPSGSSWSLFGAGG